MALYELKVNDTILLATPAGDDPQPPEGDPVTLLDFRRDYEQPAKLTFAIGRDIFGAALTPDSLVQLRIDNQLVFTGLLDPVQPSARENEPPAQIYTARDHAAALQQAHLTDVYDRQTIHLDAGRLSDVLAEYLTHCDAELERVGVSTEILFSAGAGELWTYPTSVSAEDVDAGFRAIAANTLGAACFVDPNGGSPAYRFVPLWHSDTYDVAFEQLRIGEFTLRTSTDDRVGAVRTVASVDVGEYEEWIERAMLPAWDSVHAGADTPHNAATDGDGRDPETYDTDGRIYRYRLWSFAAFADDLSTDMEMYAFSPVVNDADQRRVVYEVEAINWQDKTVLLKYPAYRTHNLDNAFGHDPFNAPAGDVYLRFRIKARANINTPSYRKPTEGFAGRAVALRPITCAVEKIIEVPPGITISEYAAQALQVLSEPVTEGSIPFNDDMPLDLVGLDRRINVVRTSGGTTGYEQLAAPLRGITFDFQQYRGTLEFSDDQTSLMKGGSQ